MNEAIAFAGWNGTDEQRAFFGWAEVPTWDGTILRGKMTSAVTLRGASTSSTLPAGTMTSTHLS